MKKLTLAAAALCVALGGTVARAQDAGALLDLLVRKSSSVTRKPRKCAPSW